MIRLSILLLAVVLATPAIAETPSFTFVQAGYQWMDIKTGGGDNIDVDGWGIGGSLELGDNLFILASFARGDMGFGIDLDETQAGIGYHTDFSDSTAFFATLTYAKVDASSDGFSSVSEDGYGASIGVRSNASDLVEVAIAISYVDLGHGSNTTSVGTEVMFNLTDRFAIGANLNYDDDATSYGGSARFYFGS